MREKGKYVSDLGDGKREKNQFTVKVSSSSPHTSI